MYRNKKDVDKHVQNLTSKLSLKEFQTRAYSIARLYFEVGDYASCQRYVEQYLTQKDNNAAALKLLGQALQRMGQKEKALDQYKASLDIDPTQTSTILDICELLADEDVEIDPGRSKYWCEKAEATFPRHPITFKLRERLLTTTNPDMEALVKFLKVELDVRPKDPTLHIRLLKHFLHANQIKEAFEHSCNVEFDDQIFLNNYAWYETLSEVLKHNSLNNNDWLHQLLVLTVKERICVLSLTEVPNGSSKSLVETSDLLFAYDQALESVHKIGPPPGFGEFHSSLVQHHRGQLAFHTATYLLKKAKKNQLTWRDATKLAGPLMLIAWHTIPLDPKVNWLTHAPKKQQNAVHRWYLEGSFRCSQSGHYILSNIQNNSQVFLDHVSQFCSGTNWRDKIFEQAFSNRDQLSRNKLKSNNFNQPPLRLPRKQEVEAYDHDAQREYPNSLHHFVWMLLNYKNYSNFKCTLFDMLTPTMTNFGAESLNKLDILAFLYSATLTCQKNRENQVALINPDKPIILPANITDLLCSLAQMKWWDCAYKYSQKELGTELTGIHATLSSGIEVVRCIDNHGLDPHLLCILGGIFSENANYTTNVDDKNRLEERACLYYSSAIHLLEKLKGKVVIKMPNKRLFDYKPKDLDTKEINALLEECKIYVATNNINEGEYEKATELLSSLKSSKAYYYLSETYKKIAFEEKKSSKDMDSETKYVSFLYRAKHYAYKSLEKLKETDVYYKNNALYSNTQELIEEIESCINKVDPDISNSVINDLEAKFSSDENVSLSGNDYISLRSNHLYHKQNISSTPKPSTKHISNVNMTNYRTAVDTQILENSILDQQLLERIEKQIKVLQKRDSNISDFMEQTKDWFDENRKLGNQIISTINSNIQNTTEQFKLLKISVDQVKDQINECRNDCKDVGELKKQIAELKKEVNKLKKVSSEQTIDESNLYNLDDEYRASDSTSSFGANIPFVPAQVLPQFAQRLVPPFPVPTNPYQLYGQNFLNLYNQYSQFNSAVTGTPQIFDPTRPQTNYPGVYPTPDQMYLDVSNLVATSIPPIPTVPTVPLAAAVTTMSSISTLSTSAPVMMAASSSKVSQSMDVKETSRLPVNVVITSSDPLPICTSAPAPILSVTIPPKHIKGSPHNYQITMPTTNDSKGTPVFSFPSNTSITTTSTPVSTTMNTMSSWNQSNIFATARAENSLSSFNMAAEISKHNDNSRSVVDGAFTGQSPNTSLNKSRTLSEKSNTSVENYDPCPDFKPIIPLPAEVKVTTGEENETVIFASRAKLYRFVDKQWKERGLGEMKLLKHKVTGKVRVLMRREQIHKICANHIILPEMEIMPMKNEAKAYFWFANDFAEETVILEKFCIRFKTAEIAKQFYAAFEDARQEAIRCTNNETRIKSSEPSNVTSNSIQTSTSNKVDFDVNAGKTVIGGFTFSSTPTFKPVEEKPKSEPKTAENTETKPNIFSGLSFKTSTSSPFTNIFITTSNQIVNNPSSDKPVQNDTSTKLNTSDTVEEFEPTIDFKPVIPLPALVEQKTGEEDEIVLFEHRAKLLRLDGAAKEWKERGLGNIKLLVHKGNNQKVRLLMRREQIMKICCNHAVTKDMIFQKMLNVDKAVTWCAKDFSDGELVAETFCLRFKTVQICDNFVEAIKSAQSKMNEDTKAAKEEHNAATQSNQSGFGDKFKPKPGSWYCDKCYTNNLETFAQCACCEQPKPNKPTNNKSTVSASFTFGFGDKFKPKAGTWECKSCMVRNEADKDACSACSSLKDPTAQKSDSKAEKGNTPMMFGIPGQTQRKIVPNKDLSAPVASNWGDKFKPKQGSWECNQCLVRNEGTVDECSACNNPRNPADNTKTATSTSKFNFGILNNDSKAKNQVTNLFDTPSTQKFNFGIPANQTAIVVSFGDQKATTSVFGITKQPATNEAPINFCLKKLDDNKSNKPALLPTPNLNWTEIKNFDFTKLSSNNQTSSSIADFINKEKESNIKQVFTSNQGKGNAVDQVPEKKQLDVKEESGSDDIIFVKEIQATAEEKQKAKELMLPENFYTYKHNKSCQGCRGCNSDDDDVKSGENVNPTKILMKSGLSLSTPAKTSTPNFQSPTNSIYGTPTFDKTVDTSVFRTPLGAIGTDTRSGSSTSSMDESNATHEENTFTEKSNTFTGNYESRASVLEGGDAQCTTATKGFILAPPKLSTMNISGTDKNTAAQIETKTTEAKSIFGENSVGISINKPIFSFNQSKTEGSEATQVKSIFGSDDQKPLNLFSGASQSSIFGPAALKHGMNKNTTESIAPSTVFGNVFSKASNNIFGIRNNDNPLSITNTTVENNDSNKASEVKKDGATNKKDSLLNVDSTLTFAALSSGGPGFNIQKKADFQWEGAGQQLFVAASREAGDKSKNETSEGHDDSGAGATAEEEYDPHYEPIVPLPDKVVVTTGEEDEDKLFGERCKLYRYDEKTIEWKERGIGEMKLLYHPVRKTYRLLLRREQVHKAVLNMLLFKNLTLLPMKNSDCAWTWAGQNFAEGAPEHETLAARFKTVAIATTFFNKVAECVEKLQVPPVESGKKDDGAKQTFSGVAPLRLPKHLENSARADGDMSAQCVQAAPPTRGQPDSGVLRQSNKDLNQEATRQVHFGQKEQDNEDEDEDEDDEDHSGHDYDNYDSDAYNEEDEESGVCYACDGKAVVRHGDEQVTCELAQVQVSFDHDICSPKILVTDANTGEILADMLIHTDTEFQMAGDSCTWSGTDYSTNDAIEKTVTIHFNDSDTAMHFCHNCETSKLSTFASTEP